MSKRCAISFTRRAPDNITEELIAVLSSKASFEFKPLFEIILLNLRERNAASGGEEMLRLRAYEKLQRLVNRGAVKRTVTGITKKYKGIATRNFASRLNQTKTAYLSLNARLCLAASRKGKLVTKQW